MLEENTDASQTKTRCHTHLRNAVEVAARAQRAKELLAHQRLHEPVLQVLSAHFRNVKALFPSSTNGNNSAASRGTATPPTQELRQQVGLVQHGMKISSL